SILAGLNLGQMQTNYLLQQGMTVADPAAYSDISSPAVSPFLWQGMYHSIMTSQTAGTGDLEMWDSLSPVISNYLNNQIIPIGVMLWDYDRIRADAVSSGIIQPDGSGQYLEQISL